MLHTKTLFGADSPHTATLGPASVPILPFPAAPAALFPNAASDTTQSDDRSGTYAERLSRPVFSVFPKSYPPSLPFLVEPARSRTDRSPPLLPHDSSQRSATYSAHRYRYFRSPPPSCSWAAPPFAQTDKDSPPPDQSSESYVVRPAHDVPPNPFSAKALRAPWGAMSSPFHPSSLENRCSRSTPSPSPPRPVKL